MPSQTTAIWAGATGAVIVVAGAAAAYWTHPGLLWPAPPPAVIAEPPPAPPPAPAIPSAAPAVAAAEKTAQPPAVKPAFDVVDVAPTGETVVAGRAAPNAKVELRDDGKTLAEATADAGGQFAMIPPALAPGAHSLTLATGQGETPPQSSNPVAISVPQPPPAIVAPAAQADAAKPSAIGDKTTSPSTSALAARVAVKSIDIGAGGRFVATGAASPNATVRLYLSGAYIGDAKTKGDGKWSLTIEHGLTSGPYALRADEINPADATVVARAEAPFDYPAQPAPAPGAAHEAPAASTSPADLVVDSVQTHHVASGNTLWGISQKFYGDGSRYELIFAANSSQIRNPNLIYPGQMLVVPKTAPKP
jgi:nucleoid-associated protein YgaU